MTELERDFRLFERILKKNSDEVKSLRTQMLLMTWIGVSKR